MDLLAPAWHWRRAQPGLQQGKGLCPAYTLIVADPGIVPAGTRGQRSKRGDQAPRFARAQFRKDGKRARALGRRPLRLVGEVTLSDLLAQSPGLCVIDGAQHKRAESVNIDQEIASRCRVTQREAETPTRLANARENECDYCASAHTLIGKGTGLSATELAANLRGESADAKTQSALDFVRAIVATRGRVSDAQVQAVRAAGYGDGEIVEIVANVAANIFTNYFNHVAATQIDFPRVNAAAPAVA